MEETTLLFRHLPAELTNDERKDLLHYLGATRVQVMGSTGRMKNTAFAVFPSKEDAAAIVHQLHQVEFLDSRLKVEFAHNTNARVESVVDNEGSQNKADLKEENGNVTKKEEEVVTPCPVKFDSTFQVWGLQYPRRPDLQYLYPPPTPTILTNILNALAAVPKFYVQVLHLMNKMDLPAPFGGVTPTPPLAADLAHLSMPDNRVEGEMDISSETESEIESDISEGERERRAKAKRPVKRQRKMPRIDREQAKKLRLSELQESGEVVEQTHSIPVSEVFERVSDASGGGRKISLKLPSSIQAQPPSLSQVSSRVVEPSSSVQGASPLPHTPYSIQFPNSSTNTHGGQIPTQNQQFSYEDTVKSHQDTKNQSRLQDPSLRTPEADPPVDFSHITLQQQAGRSQDSLASDNSTRGWQTSHKISQGDKQTTAAVSESSKDADEYGPQLPPNILPESVPSREQESLPATTGGFGIIEPQKKIVDVDKTEEEEGEKEWGKSKFISSSELRKRKLSKSEMAEYNVFKRYQEGEPSCRLYIKNLAKQVSEEDIHWLFGRYVDWDDEMASTIFDIRLMKEGRMKGQAFVTLISEKAAVQAVRDTNGLMLKDKPMVVQFARSAKAQGDEASRP